MPLKKDILHPTPLSKIRAKLSATCMSFGGHDFYNAFALFDDDHSGDLSCQEFINAIRRNLKMSGATMPNKDIKAVSTAPLQTAARPQSPPPPIPEHRTSPFLPPPPGLQIARHRRNRLADGRRDRSFRAPQGDRPGA